LINAKPSGICKIVNKEDMNQWPYTTMLAFPFYQKPKIIRDIFDFFLETQIGFRKESG